MNLRLPLYARILGLFLLNVLVIAGALIAVFRMQFDLGLDSFLAGEANRRVQALSRVIIGELQATPLSEIETVLTRFSKAFEVDLYVVRSDGIQVAGEPIVLPREVERTLRRLGGRWGRGGPAGQGLGLPRGPRFGQQPPETGLNPSPLVPPDDALEPLGDSPRSRQPELADRRSESDRSRGRGPRWQQGVERPLAPRNFFLKSAAPTRYWAGTVFPLQDSSVAGQPLVLLIVSDSITGGGLFLDVTPWVAAGCGVLVLSALIWLPFVRSITRALGQMTRTTRDISVGRFQARVVSKRGDELGRLAEAINEMAIRLEGFVNGQRRFLGDVAHELCSPLARIQTALGILEQRTDPQGRPYVKDLQEEADHMSQLVGELLSFSKATIEHAKTPVESTVLADLVAQAVRREQAPGAVIEQHLDSDLTVQSNPELLQRAIANLLRNAVRYAASAGPITLSAWRDGDAVILEVADNGPGVPEASLAKLFDPFYRVDTSRTRETGGVGLGLTIVKTCVEACGGTVHAANRRNGGLRVQIRLKR